MSELDDRKTQAEIAHLEAETRKLEQERVRLDKPWRDWTLEAIKILSAIALGAGGAFAAVTGYQLSEIKKERLDYEAAKTQDDIAKLRVQRAEFDAQVASAQQQLAAFKSELEKVQQSIKDAQKAHDSTANLQDALSRTNDIQQAVTRANIQFRSINREPTTQLAPGDLLVGLQTTGIGDPERTALNDKLKAAGYGLHELSESYDTPPQWFSPASSVLYYSPRSKEAAKRLAAEMKTLTGETFEVRQGSGLGVDPNQTAITLFVHYKKH